MDGKLVAIRTISLDCTADFAAFKRVRLSLSPYHLSSMTSSIWFLQRLCTNGVMWKRLQHPNVVSFVGFSSVAPPFSLVYHWMPNGNLSDYVRGNPEVDKLDLVSGYSRPDRQPVG